MNASGVRVDNTSDTVGVVEGLSGSGVSEPASGGTAAGLPAVTLLPGGILFCARTISGRLFPRAATWRTACVTVGSLGQKLMLKILQSPVLGSLRRA